MALRGGREEKCACAKSVTKQHAHIWGRNNMADRVYVCIATCYSNPVSKSPVGEFGIK